jgi:hypothetical protein
MMAVMMMVVVMINCGRLELKICLDRKQNVDKEL